MTCADCYHIGLRRGKDEKGHAYKCREMHINIRSYSNADKCPNFKSRREAYCNQQIRIEDFNITLH